MGKFAHLKPAVPIGKVTAEYTLWDLEDEPTLVVRTSADPNRDYRDALMTRVNQSRRKFRNQRDDNALERLQHSLDLELFPEHVVTGWRNVKDGEGQDVPFSAKDCADYLKEIDGARPVHASADVLC